MHYNVVSAEKKNKIMNDSKIFSRETLKMLCFRFFFFDIDNDKSRKKDEKWIQ